MLRISYVLMVALAGISCCAVAQVATETADKHNQAPTHESPPGIAQLFEQTGPHKRTITTSSAEAQEYFDQGLTWAYAMRTRQPWSAVPS